MTVAPTEQKRNTGPEAIYDALSKITIEDIEARGRAGLATKKKTKRGESVALLNIAKGLRNNQLSPKDYMMQLVPIVPPKYRPFSAQGDSLIPGDANVLYKDFFDVKDAYDQEKKMFGDQNMGQATLDLYDSIRAVTGFGDPVKQKTAQKEVKGFLKKIVGKTSKQSFFQSKMIAKTMDSVGRSTVVVNPELGIDDIELPTDIAFTMYAPYIQRRLKRMGMGDADALRAVKDQTDYARRALEAELKERPVIYSRAPAWHKFSINAGNVKLTDGDAIGTNPYVAAGMGMDYDGDTINVHVPSSDEAVKEAYEKLMPSKDPFSDRMEGKIVPLPKQEQIMGLYSASISDDPRTYDFNTEEEALDAIKRGQIPTTANVNILHGVKRASVWQNEEMKQNIIKRHPFKDPKTGKFMNTQKQKQQEIDVSETRQNTES